MSAQCTPPPTQLWPAQTHGQMLHDHALRLTSHVAVHMTAHINMVHVCAERSWTYSSLKAHCLVCNGTCQQTQLLQPAQERAVCKGPGQQGLLQQLAQQWAVHGLSVMSVRPDEHSSILLAKGC